MKTGPDYFTAPNGYISPNFTENCTKCGGSGRWRPGYPCFTCKGSGKLTFKNPADVRAKNRANTAASKAKKAAETEAAHWAAFQAAQPEVAAWMEAGVNDSFAISLRRAVIQWGDLTEKQLAAAQGSIARQAAYKANAEARVTEAKPVNMSALEAAFAQANTKLKNPRLRVAGMIVSPAKASSANAGALYVKVDETYLGKIMGGKFIRSRECTADLETKVLEVAADPKGAAIAYGRLTGNCACCGRGLTDPVSVANGIGPICAEKFGW